MTVRLVVFDLDGTLIRGDTCCELIAARIGRLEQMREFERCTTEEEIAWARSEMSRWYRAFSEEELCAALTGASEAPGLQAGIQRLRAAGVTVGIASITWSFAVRWFANRLGAEYHVGTHLRPNGTIDHVWPDDKARWLEELTTRLGLKRIQNAAIGDSVSDLPMLRAAGRSFYLGKNRPDGNDIEHLPDADIDEIARLLLQSS